MKRKFTKLIAALALLLFVAPPIVGWAADETLVFSQMNLENGVQYTTINGTDCTLTFGDGGNDGKYYTTGAAIRVYGGGHMTVSSTTRTIEKIELTFGTGDGSNAITTDVNTYSNGTWQGSAQSSVTFTVGGTSGHRRIASVAITYSSGGSQLTPTTTTITVPQNFNDDLYVGTTAGTLTAAVTETGSGNAVSGATITWASSDPGVATVNQNGAVTLVAAGTTDISATYAGDATYAGSNDTYQLTVVDNTPNVTFVAGTDTGETSVTKDGITVTMSTMSRTDNYRCYANTDMTVTSTAEKTITKVVLTCVSSYGANNFSIPTGNPGSYSYSQNNLTGTWTGSTNTVTLHAGSQVRITQIVVTYETHQAQQYTLEVTALTNAGMHVFDATDPDETNWGSLFIGIGSAQVYENTPIALSVSADQGYALTELMVDGIDHVLDIVDGLYTFTMPSHNVTITATAALAYDITYSSNGMEDQVQVTSTTLELPAGEDLDSEFSFAGWTTNPNNVVNILPTGTQVTIQGGEMFYAVYAHTEGQEAYFQKVTEAPQDWSGDYLIVAVGEYANNGGDYSVAFNGSLVDQGLDAEQNTIDVEITNDRIELDEYNGSAFFTIAPIVDDNEITGWSIQSASGYYVGRTTNSNGMNRSETTVYSHTLSIDGAENAVITSSANPALNYNKASDQKRFRYYKDNGQQPIQLYKKTIVSQGTTAYYTRVFIWETAEDDITIAGPSIVPSGSTLDMGSHSLGYAQGVSNLIIEDGGQLVSGPVQGTMLKNITGTDFGSQANPTNAGYYLIASPLAVAPTAVNNMIVTANGDYDLYAFDPTAEMEWQNYKSSSNFTLALGKGYLYANSNTTTLEFAGLLNSGFAATNLNYVAGDDLHSLNLVGNPFAHEYDFVVKQNSDAVDFNYLTLNATGDGFITNNTGDNAAVTLDPMEAILVQAPGTGYRFDDPNAGDMPGIIDDGEIEGLLNISVSRNRGASVGSTGIIDNALVSFGNAPLMKKIRLNDNATELCMLQGGEEMAVVRAQGQGELPVSFKAAENGSYTLSVEVNNVEMDYLHLIDNMTGADVDLLATPSYTFEAKTSDYASRFRLVFSANSVASEGACEPGFAYYNGSSWTVSNIGEATLQVVDVMGRVLSSETLSGNAEVSINQTPGVYMLRLVSGDSVKVQKVVVR